MNRETVLDYWFPFFFQGEALADLFSDAGTG
jgi:hypothetical protein